MSACLYSIFFLFSFLFICFAYQQQSSIDLNFIDDENLVQSLDDDKWQSNDDESIDQSKLHRAAYQHEQDLLAKIYSPDRTYISMHDGRIYPTNFTYFTFNSLGTYRFILITSRGDADLYISTRNKHVTYSDYEYSSCTCGIDEILIDSRVKRPIYLGIYGYSQYKPSDYRLLIELIDSTISSDETNSFSTDDNDEKSSNVDYEQYNSHSNTKPSSIIVEGERNTNHLIWDIFLGLLEVLEAVL